MSNRGSSASCRLQHCSSRAVATSLDPLSSGVCPVIWSLSCLLESVLSCHLESVLSSGVCPVIWSLSCHLESVLSCHLESVLSSGVCPVLSSGVCPVIWSLSCHLESVLSPGVCPVCVGLSEDERRCAAVSCSSAERHKLTDNAQNWTVSVFCSKMPQVFSSFFLLFLLPPSQMSIWRVASFAQFSRVPWCVLSKIVDKVKHSILVANLQWQKLERHQNNAIF